MPTFGSLFSGQGLMDLGLTRAGWECRWQVEIEDYDRALLAQRFPWAKQYADVREVGDELERVDLVAGGFPCQPVSQAGARKAQADARWLWPEFARVVSLVRPRFVLVENVVGLLNAGMGEVLGDLSSLGFDAEWSVVPACALGATHPRERVFIVAHAPGAGQLRAEQLEDDQGSERGRRRAADPLATSEVLGSTASVKRSGHWAVEPSLGRVAYGVPHRVDRLRGIGNGVVVHVAEFIGQRLREVA